MRSSLAAVLAVAVCLLQAQALAFHVHAVPEHGGRDRHAHAPAIHHHHGDDPVADLRLSDDDGDVGTITLTVPAATSLDGLPSNAVPVDIVSFERPEQSARTPAVELHSHGPPLAGDSVLRGPPASALR